MSIKISKNTINCISRKLERKGIGKVSKLGSFNENGYQYLFYGYTDGKAGSENKYEFPPPYDNELYYGDIIVLKQKGEKLLILF